MAKVESHPEVMMDVELKKELLSKRTQKEIMIQSDLKGKLIIFSEDIIFKDGSCDFIYYYLDKKASLKDPDTIIYVDYYSKRKAREKSIEEFKKRRRRVV